MKKHLNLFILFLFLLMLFLLSCQRSFSPVNTEVDFGYRYSIRPPINSNVMLKNDSLLVQVAYSGCSSPHQFEFHYYTTDGEATVWFTKLTPDQSCEAYFTQWLRVKLPSQVVRKSKLIFLAPEDVSLVLYQ
ncbi:MAG: hypothetical protein D6748_07180 [Calditrichaeota bacterium]|nr:MAG: hypothetical protein D6748_07180 [Calditrichota bacterium]